MIEYPYEGLNLRPMRRRRPELGAEDIKDIQRPFLRAACRRALWGLPSNLPFLARCTQTPNILTFLENRPSGAVHVLFQCHWARWMERPQWLTPERWIRKSTHPGCLNYRTPMTSTRQSIPLTKNCRSE